MCCRYFLGHVACRKFTLSGRHYRDCVYFFAVARAHVLGADQKKRGLWGEEWEHLEVYKGDRVAR